MKNFKRLISVLLCVITLFMLATPAMAIDVNDDKMPVIIQQLKDVVIVRPVGAFDPNPGPRNYYPEFEVSLPDEYRCIIKLYCGDKLVSVALGVDDAPSIDRNFIKPGEYYLIIENSDYPEYTVKSEPFKVTFVKKPFNERVDIAIKSIGPYIRSTIDGFANVTVMGIWYVLANIIAVPLYIQ